MNNHKEAIQPIILLVTARLDYTLNGSCLIIVGWSVPHKLGRGREGRTEVKNSFDFFFYFTGRTKNNSQFMSSR